MKTLIIVLLITLAWSQCASDETLFKSQCIKNSCFDTYLKRFKTVAGADGIGRIPITFVGEIQWVGSNVEVTLQFTDEASDGTMKRDNTNSCITDKLYYYKAGWTQETQATYSITSSYNYTTSYRVWKFTIPAADLNSKLQADQSTGGTIVYTGYFGFKFFVVDVVQVTYRFTFTLTLNTSTKSMITTTFNPLLQNDTATCTTNGACIAEASSSLQFCSEPTCASPTVSAPKLYLNQKFWILQKITTSGFTSFKLELVSVNFQGNGLNKKVNPASAVSSSGQLIIGLDVSFAYDSNVDIYIDSKLASSRRRVLQRILADTTGSVPDPAHAMQNTGDLGCIKLNESDSACPTCDQLKEKGITCSAQQEAFNPENSGFIVFFAFALLLLFI